MTGSHLTLISPQPDPVPLVAVTEASIRAFVDDLTAEFAPATVQRYGTTVDALFHFLDVIDVGPRLGPEIAEHLGAARRRHGAGAFLPTLGVVSLVRVLPEFLEDPWLPRRGAQRRTHRAVLGRLLRFVRRNVPNPALVRDELARVRRAVDKDRMSEYGGQSRPVDDERAVLVRSTLEIRPTRLDQLLDSVELGDFDSLDVALTDVVDPRHDETGWRSWY